MPFKLKRPSAIPYAIAVVVAYYIFQVISFWSTQNQEVREHTSLSNDYVVLLFIGFFGLLSLAYSTILKSTYDADDNFIWRWWDFLAVVVLSGGLAAASHWPSQLLRKQRVAQTASEELKISEELVSHDWLMIFNPTRPVSSGSKQISFSADGTIGNGRNNNEHGWRVRGRFLEILNSENKVFSRFTFNAERNAFLHTNDEDTLSLRNQRIEKLSRR